MITINSSFIGIFKLGDNIVYNLSALEELYEAQNRGSRHLRKQIIVLIGSIAEALLYDLYAKINNLVHEGVGDIPEETLDAIREKKISKFHFFIEHAEDKSLLNANDRLYGRLYMLKDLRNRIHIANTKKMFAPDDFDAFDASRQKIAEKALEEMMKVMEKRYSRGEKKRFVQDFILPWTAHFHDIK